MVKLVKKSNGKRRKAAEKWLDEKPGERERREREEREERLRRMRFLREPLTHRPFVALVEADS